jgi:hypothetical protein
MAMNAAEMAVATAAPALGMGQAASNTAGAYPGSSNLAFSASMIPTVNVDGLGALRQCFQRTKSGGASGKPGGGSNGGGSGAGGKPGPGGGGGGGKGPHTVGGYAASLLHNRIGQCISLPAQTEEYSLLCAKASTFWQNVMLGMLQEVGFGGPVIEKLDVAKEWLGVGFGTFCSPLGGALSGDDAPPEVKDRLAQSAIDSCKADIDAELKKDSQGRIMVAGDEVEVVGKHESRVFEVGGDGTTEEKFRKNGKLMTRDELVEDCKERKLKVREVSARYSTATSTACVNAASLAMTCRTKTPNST